MQADPNFRVDAVTAVPEVVDSETLGSTFNSEATYAPPRSPLADEQIKGHRYGDLKLTPSQANAILKAAYESEPQHANVSFSPVILGPDSIDISTLLRIGSSGGLRREIIENFIDLHIFEQQKLNLILKGQEELRPPTEFTEKSSPSEILIEHAIIESLAPIMQSLKYARKEILESKGVLGSKSIKLKDTSSPIEWNLRKNLETASMERVRTPLQQLAKWGGLTAAVSLAALGRGMTLTILAESLMLTRVVAPFILVGLGVAYFKGSLNSFFETSYFPFSNPDFESSKSPAIKSFSTFLKQNGIHPKVSAFGDVTFRLKSASEYKDVT